MGKIAQESRVGWSSFSETTKPYLPELRSGDAYTDRAAIETQAYELLANRQQITGEYKTEQTYHDDARTALFEALTASGHLSRVEISGTLEEIHHTMLSVLLNAYSDNLPKKEKNRRFQELCNELTRQDIERQVAAGLLPPDTQVAEISDFIEGVSRRSAQSLGYRPDNTKGMVRSSWLVKNQDATYMRVSEQVSRSNAAATQTESFLRAEGLPLRLAHDADVRVLGTTQIHELSAGVVGLMKRLDNHRGVNIRYGEVAHAEQLTYEQLREESLKREQQAECFVERLAQFTERLDSRLQSGELTYQQHQELLKQEIKGILRTICTMRPEYAKDCFGEAAVQTYYEASDKAAAGDMTGAAGLIESKQHLESTVSLCGMSISSDKAKELGVQSSELERLIRFGLENWSWTRGICRVDECPTRPGQTEVGPCSICRGCQREFEHGRNPARLYRRMKQLGEKAVQSFWGWLAPKSEPKEEFKFFDFSHFKKAKEAREKSKKHETMAA